jgi:hypothetical protein
MSNSKSTITIPKTLLEKLEDSFEEIEEVREELETILLSKDPVFLKKMRQSRLEHRQGKTRPLKALKSELCIK